MLNKDEIKDKVDNKKFYSDMIPGIRFGTAVSSPFREDKHPSFVVYNNTGIWKDLATGEAGDVIGYVMNKMNLDFVPALEYLRVNYTQLKNNQNPTNSIETKKSGMKTFSKSEHQQMIDDLQSGKFPEIEKQIVERKLSKAVLLKHKVGAGRHVFKDKDGNFHKFECFVFPYDYGNDSDLTCYKKIPYLNGKKPRGFIRQTKGGTFFPQANLDNDGIILCEGELDALALETLGFQAVTVANGAGAFKSEYADHLVGKAVTILYDNDPAGQDGQKNAASVLFNKASSVKLAQWDKDKEGYDACEFLGSGRDAGEMKTLLEQAQAYKPIEKTISKIRQANDKDSRWDATGAELVTDRGNLREDNVAEFMRDNIYRNDKGELILCSTRFKSQRSFHVYKDGVWEKTDADKIKMDIIELARHNEYSYKNRDLNAVLDVLRSITYVPAEKFNSRSDLINLNNGTYDLVNFEITAHNPAHYFTYKNDYDYNKNAVCPVFDETIEYYSSYEIPDKNSGSLVKNTDPDWVQALWEIFGLCMTDITKYQKMFFLYGPGGRGKGTLLRIFDRLVGFKRTKPNFKPKTVDGKFSKKALIGKHLAITGDLLPFMENIDTIKELTGEDRQSTDVKYGDEIDFVNKAKFIFAMNTLPNFPKDEALQPILRRILLLPFDMDIEKRNGDIETELHAEMSGIFNAAIKELKHLLQKKEKELTTCKRGTEYLDSYLDVEKNTFELFCSTRIVVDPNRSVFIHDLWNDYEIFMDSHAAGWRNNKALIRDAVYLGRGLAKHPKLGNVFTTDKETDKDYIDVNDVCRPRRTTIYKGISLRNKSDIIRESASVITATKDNSAYPPEKELDGDGNPTF
ncbi:MAG: toprim domain-containing protein [Chlorobi bacterium]|nr:toprim domain-containing protein [Chlorobiota bacterium]